MKITYTSTKETREKAISELMERITSQGGLLMNVTINDVWFSNDDEVWKIIATYDNGKA